VAAVPDPATGELGGLVGRHAALPPDPPPARPTAAPAGQAGRLARTALGVVGLLGLGLTAVATCLRWRELELEERALALREREAARRDPPGGP
jgi:hypothetical protein